MTYVCLLGVLNSSRVEVASLPAEGETLAPALQLAVDLASQLGVSCDGATDIPCSQSWTESNRSLDGYILIYRCFNNCMLLEAD